MQSAEDNPNNQQPTFTESIMEAVDSHVDKAATPLLDHEKIIDEEPARINLTAVVCTAIVAVCATIVLCVAKPWSNSSDIASVAVEQEQQADPAPVAKADSVRIKEEQQRIAAEEKRRAEEQRIAAEKAAAEKAAEQKRREVATATQLSATNIYRNCRLIDASSRKLTKSDVEGLSKNELALARNSIYARHGYQFKEPNLKEYFATQSWFKAKDIEIGNVEMTETEVYNVNLIKAQENKQ